MIIKPNVRAIIDTRIRKTAIKRLSYKNMCYRMQIENKISQKMTKQMTEPFAREGKSENFEAKERERESERER